MRKIDLASQAQAFRIMSIIKQSLAFPYPAFLFRRAEDLCVAPGLSLWLIPFKRREKEEEEDIGREGREGVVTWGDKRIERETEAQVSQRSYLSPAGCKRAS